MALLSVIAIILPLVYLLLRRPDTMMEYLPEWIYRRSQRDEKPPRAEQQDTGDESTYSSSPPDNSQTTPKVNGLSSPTPVPAFSLSGDGGSSTTSEAVLPSGTFSQTEMMPPPGRPPNARTTGLMAPPTRPAVLPPGGSAGLSPAASMRMPSSRSTLGLGLPATSQQRASGSGGTANGRGKILLAPGHSPMDWAALTRRGNLSGVTKFERVTPSRLKTMTGRKGKPAWTSWQGKVYNITPYLPFHPGGEPELLRAAGRDATQLFMDVHPWVNFDNMLSSCLVGAMVPEGGSPLEDMD